MSLLYGCRSLYIILGSKHIFILFSLVSVLQIPKSITLYRKVSKLAYSRGQLELRRSAYCCRVLPALQMVRTRQSCISKILNQSVTIQYFTLDRSLVDRIRSHCTTSVSNDSGGVEIKHPYNVKVINYQITYYQQT